MDIEIGVKNYRSIGDEIVWFRLQDGFTALVGVNNSGKSSILRLLYELRGLLRALNTVAALNINSDGIAFDLSFSHGERMWRAGEETPIEIYMIVHDGPKGAFTANNELVEIKLLIPYESNRALISYTGVTTKNELTVPWTGTGSLAAAFRLLGDSMYIGPFRNTVNVGGATNYFDIQTGEAFIKKFAEYKSGADPHSNEAIAETVDNVRRIFGFTTLEINPTPSGTDLRVIVNGKSFRLEEMGAGLAHFIVVLVNILIRRPSLLMIDEPELNLHSSLQLDFLTTIAKYAKYGVFFATHNLGLARSSADRIYLVTKTSADSTNVKQYQVESDLVSLIGQLSFGNRPELGFDRVLLVEGKSELLAIAQLLRIYKKEHEVLLLPLHGRDLINGNSEAELRGLMRIGDKIMYLIDSERTSKTASLDQQRTDFVALCTRLGIEGHVLERRALENYFPEHAIQKFFGQSAHALGEYDKDGRVWPKTSNWRIASEMSRADLDKTDLGTFLRDEV